MLANVSEMAYRLYIQETVLYFLTVNLCHVRGKKFSAWLKKHFVDPSIRNLLEIRIYLVTLFAVSNNQLSRFSGGKVDFCFRFEVSGHVEGNPQQTGFPLQAMLFILASANRTNAADKERHVKRVTFPLRGPLAGSSWCFFLLF